MNKVPSILLAAAAVLAAGATEPSLEIVASSTNLVVTEHVSLSLVLRLPPVPGKYADEQQPFFNQRPPHVTCSFLERAWKGEAFDRGDLDAPFGQIPRRGVRGPAFTFNNFVTDGFSAMMDDPLDILDGPRRLGRCVSTR